MEAHLAWPEPAGFDFSADGSNCGSSEQGCPMCALCERQVAYFFCTNDAAFLCASCDNEVHGSNPLAARHERVLVSSLGALETLSMPAAPACEGLTRDDAEGSASGLALSPKNSDSSELMGGVHLSSAEAGVKQELTDVTDASLADVPMAPTLKGDKELEAFLDWDGALLDLGLELDAFENEIMTQHLASDGVVPIAEPAESSCSGASPLSEGKAPDSVGSASLPSLASGGSAAYAISSYGAPVTQAAAYMPGVVPQYAMQPSYSTMPAGWPGFYAVQDAGYSHEASIAREARHQSIKRYREKRQRRIFEKTIRYQSRKAYAEIRPRIKGRFAKREEMAALAAEAQTQQPDSSVDPGEELVVPVC